MSSYNDSEAKLSGCAAAILLGVWIAISGAAHMSRDVYHATVTKQRYERDNDSDKYLVYTRLENGEVRVFENRDSWVEGKTASSNLEAQLEPGKRYKISTYGWRIPLVSCYENILEVEEEPLPLKQMKEL